MRSFKYQSAALSSPPKDPNVYPNFPQLFNQLIFKLMPSLLKKRKNLKSRHILPESYSLPFKASAKFFHPSLPTSKKVCKKAYAREFKIK